MGYCEIVYKLPKGEKAGLPSAFSKKIYGYLRVLHFGNCYHIPIVKEFRKVIEFKIRKGKIIIDSDRLNQLDDFIRSIIGIIYITTRNIVGSDLHRKLSNQIQEGLSKMYDNQLMNLIEKKFPKKLPEGNKK